MSEACASCGGRLHHSERQHRVTTSRGALYFHAERDSACSHAAFAAYKRGSGSIRLLETFTDRR